MKKLIAVVILLPMVCLAEEDTSGQACTDALNAAEKKVREQANYYNNMVNTSSQTLQSGVQQPGVTTTGNPMTDLSSGLARLDAQAAQVSQQRIDALGQVEDNCFQQNESLSDNEQKSLVSDIRRQQEITKAEADKIRQDAEIKAECAKEAAKNFQTELERRSAYQSRIVSNVGAATQGQAKLRALEEQFYNRCWNSHATQIALDGNREALELKMRNFITEAQAVMAEREYINVKRSHLNAYCALQVDRVDEKNRMAVDAIKQQQQQMQMGMMMSIFTAQNAAADQGTARENFSSLDQLLMAQNWEQLKTACMNLHTSNSTTTAYSAPMDVAPYFNEVNTACRPAGASSNTKCVISSGANSAERQRSSTPGTSR